MQASLAPDVAAANALTRKWCAAAGSSDFVLSGYGLWPLLAILTATAAEPARTELAEAVGTAPDDAHKAAMTLLERLGGAESIHAALGVWVRDDLEVHDEWAASLPPETISALRSRAGLDEWTHAHTDGLLDRFPADLGESTVLALVTAVVARTAWRDSFHCDVLEPSTGPWRGHRGPGLSRYGGDLRDAAVLDTESPVTRVVVRGTADLDVHLLLGEDDAPAATVLGAGLDALDGAVDAHRPTLDSSGPGLTVQQVTAVTDSLRIQLPPFEIRRTHDLLDACDLFGLRAATAASGIDNLFPGLSPVPLAVSAAAQQVRARFTADGFEAVAATAMTLAPTSMRVPTDAIEIAVTFDRPFGFLAVHRPTGAAVVAGWVATPPV